MKNVQLLAIDVQNDFANPKGSLFVKGADNDVIRLANFINKMGNKIVDIHVTLGSHRCFQIFFPLWWINEKREHPDVYTTISVRDVESGKWKATIPHLQEKSLAYVRMLAKGGRYPLTIWPYHTLIGTWGSSLVPVFSDALIKWEKDNCAVVNYLAKGSNLFTEAYSIYKCEVPDPNDPSTLPNKLLLKLLQRADEILVGGEALNYCVASSVYDLANDIGAENVKKFILLTDTTSNVAGSENLGEKFIKEMGNRGMRTMTTTEYLKG